MWLELQAHRGKCKVLQLLVKSKGTHSSKLSWRHLVPCTRQVDVVQLKQLGSALARQAGENEGFVMRQVFHCLPLASCADML